MRVAFTNSAKGGGVQCIGFRMAINLAVVDSPVWPLRDMPGPFPITRAWGYHYLDVPCVSGNSPNNAYVRR